MEKGAGMFICMQCGTIAEEAEVCCGEARTSLEEALDTQAQLFVLTGNDRAQHVLARLKGLAEAAGERVRKAEEKLVALRAQREVAIQELLDFYQLTQESRAPEATGDV